jgi:hypothetical protein
MSVRAPGAEVAACSTSGANILERVWANHTPKLAQATRIRARTATDDVVLKSAEAEVGEIALDHMAAGRNGEYRAIAMNLGRLQLAVLEVACEGSQTQE